MIRSTKMIMIYKMRCRIERAKKMVMLLLVISCCFCLTCIDAAILTAPNVSKKQRQRKHIPISLFHSSLENDDSLLSIRGGDSNWMVGLKDSIASALAAACSKTILAPFDTIKTVQQQYQSPNGASLRFLPACRLIMNRPQGFWSLYAGLGVSVLGSMPSVGLYFGVYSYCKRTIYPLLKQKFGQHVSNSVLWTVSIAASAAVGNTVASFSRVPYEVVKQNLQTGMYSNTYQAVTQMARLDGWRAFFPMGGISIQMMRDIPYAMVTLLSYEYLRQKFVMPYKEKHPQSSAWCDMLAGAIAGGIGSYVTNPLDVVKTRLQSDSSKYKGSMVVCAQETWQEGGNMAFLRGSVPRLMHKIPANAFFFLFYEFFRRLLHVEGATVKA